MSQHDEPTEAVETLQGGELAYRVSEPGQTQVRDLDDGGPILEGRMMPYNEWTEIRSSVEGHFMERFAPGSLAKTMNEQRTRIRALYEHGLDLLGKQAIADIEAFEDRPDDGAWYRATILDGVPPLIMSGLRRGLYGTSIRFRPIKFDRVSSPRSSDHNPERIPEVTVREALLHELSIVTFPQYAGATAGVRSLTDEIAARKLLGDPERLLDYLRSTTETEPQHSEPEEPDVQAPEPSRSTQRAHDYLTPEEDTRSWLL